MRARHGAGGTAAVPRVSHGRAVLARARLALLQGARHRRQREAERAALAERALAPDAAAVLLHDRAGDRQAEARAALLARVARVHLLEAVEDRLALVGGDAAAAVAHPERHPVLAPLGAERDARAAWRELHGVRDEVHEHLHRAVGVGPHREVRALDV